MTVSMPQGVMVKGRNREIVLLPGLKDDICFVPGIQLSHDP